MMNREVFCTKLQKKAAGLMHPPYLRNELGARIYREISEEAYKMWLHHAVMFINENRLNPSEPEGQQRLNTEMARFLFDDPQTPEAMSDAL